MPVGGGESALAGTPRRAREPRPRRKLRSEVAQELRGRVVHPVDVVEDEQRGRVEEVPEQRPHDAVQARTPEGRIEIVDLGGRRDLDVERRGEQRRPRHELLVDRVQPLAEDGAVVLTTSVQLNVEQRAEERPERVVRRGRLVLLAAQRRSAACRRSSRAAPRASRDFPIPGSPTSSTSVPKPMRTGATDAPRTARSRSRSTNGSSSRTSEGSALSGAARSSPSTNACTGSALPLSNSGSSSVDANDRAAARERPGRDPDLVLSGARHEPRRQRRRVAEHGVRPPEARADLAGEDASLAHADVNRERKARVDDRANRSEHPLLVVAEGLRRARHEDDATAVAVDVAFEERHLVLVRGRSERPVRARRARRRPPRVPPSR